MAVVVVSFKNERVAWPLVFHPRIVVCWSRVARGQAVLKRGGGKVSSTYALSYCFYLTGNITFALQMDAFWGVVGQGLVIFFTFVGQGLVKGTKRWQKRAANQMLVKEETKIHVGQMMVKRVKKTFLGYVGRLGVGQERCWSSYPRDKI